jgi:hypothetical protein
MTVPQLSIAEGPSSWSVDASRVATNGVSWRGASPWQIRTPSSGRLLSEAYADAPSYLPGETVRLAVSTSASFYEVSIWRMGGSITQMYRSGRLAGIHQTATVIDPATGLVRADWRYTFQFDIPATWPTGIYLARVAASRGADSYVKFVVRSATASALLFVDNVLTEAAYNRWGGASLYQSAVGIPTSANGHAIQVSLNRPSMLENGAGLVFLNELSLAGWLERQGYDVAYTTDWDLSRAPWQQATPRAIVFSGHSEYWSVALRTWLDELVLKQGAMSLGLFASNSGYWPVEISDDGRTITCYKEAITKPDLLNVTASQDGLLKTLRFRDLPSGDRDPRNWPEQTLFGVQYGSIISGFVPYLLGSVVPLELLMGTQLGPGSSIGTIAGGETDYVDASYLAPQAQAVVAEASGVLDRYGSPGRAIAVFRTDPSGARVFAAGTQWWGSGLDPVFARAHNVPEGFAQLTLNIVNALLGTTPAKPT